MISGEKMCSPERPERSGAARWAELARRATGFLAIVLAAGPIVAVTTGANVMAAPTAFDVQAASSTSAANFDLAALMAMLARVRSGQASFTEQRFVRTLDAPLAASGTLSFTAPDRFARNTTSPRPESMSVDGNVVTLSRGGRSRTFTLDALPEMTGLVEAVRGTLTGNLDAVTRYFKTSLAGTPADWTLTLTPLESRTGGQVQQMHISGRGADLARIEMRLTDGDYSVMTITPMSAKPAP